MKNYSDIIFDHLQENAKFKENAESRFEKGQHGFLKETYEIKTTTDSQRLHKPKGRYTLLTLKNILCNSQSDKYYLNKLIESLKDYLPNIKTSDTILVIGLGNRHISADSLGVEVVKNITITRNLIKNTPKLCAFAPSVLGLTGIESADTIAGISAKIKPNYIIMIDSLCASDTSRLGVSFQLSDTPITPGSGINNTRKKVTNPCKTISIGVPLVVYATTFIKSTLNKLNLDNKTYKNALNIVNNVPFNELVTLSEIEPIVKKIGRFIAQAINKVVLE